MTWARSASDRLLLPLLLPVGTDARFAWVSWGFVGSCFGLENRFTGNGNEGSNPSLSAENQANPGEDQYPQQVTDCTGINPEGSVPMQIGCKQDASTTDVGNLSEAIILSWPNLPEHIKLAVFTLVEPYRYPSGTTG